MAGLAFISYCLNGYGTHFGHFDVGGMAVLISLALLQVTLEMWGSP